MGVVVARRLNLKWTPLFNTPTALGTLHQVRETPSTDGETLGVVSASDEIVGIGEYGDWIHVQVDLDVGFLQRGGGVRGLTFTHRATHPSPPPLGHVAGCLGAVAHE